MVASDSGAPAYLRAHRGAAVRILLCGSVFVVGLLWAKWAPYAHKAAGVGRTHRWPGSNILTVGGVKAGDAPSWHAATTFFHAYVAAIWPALLVALLLSAAVQAMVPPHWLNRVLNRRRLFIGVLAGGAAGMPSMMCTCCAAPVAATLRRSGVTPAASVAYWLANPLLNPAVLVFLILVGPWQWTAVRLVLGPAVVFGVAALVGRLTRAASTTEPRPDPVDDVGFAVSARRFATALTRLCLTLLPEYALLVLALGAARGWALTLTQPAHQGLLIVLAASVVGTLIVIPTAGEIPVIQALSLLGAPSGMLGALLITLPAVSLPGAAMLVRDLGARVIGITAVAVAAAGLLGAMMLTVLS